MATLKPKTYVERFYEVIEDYGRLNVGDLLKNILQYCNFAHREELAYDKNNVEKLIEGLQDEVRQGEYMSNLQAEGITSDIIAQQPRLYFGNYSTNQQEFKFCLADKTNLSLLINLITDVSETRRIRESVWSRLSALDVGQKTRPVIIPPGQVMDRNQIESDKKKIIAQITKDDKGKNHHKFDAYLKDKLKDIELEITAEADGNGPRKMVARIKCLICGILMRAGKSKKKESSEGSWTAWNFVLHFLRNSNTSENLAINNENTAEAEVPGQADSALANEDSGNVPWMRFFLHRTPKDASEILKRIPMANQMEKVRSYRLHLMRSQSTIMWS
ncbi:hypothetical protein QAD02_013031 [Eretmocerus hayati]|uniref:Uncharacterized protein n=1 Tax=Eretmocerus hayati TaxID=131215 RepID=A0ACC2P119_9HYME|nr:hypothetical protein QAD02_013031 [Eretmocerus hayati]